MRTAIFLSALVIAEAIRPDGIDKEDVGIYLWGFFIFAALDLVDFFR